MAASRRALVPSALDGEARNRLLASVAFEAIGVRSMGDPAVFAPLPGPTSEEAQAAAAEVTTAFTG